MDIPHTPQFIPNMLFIISLLAVQARAHMIMANPTPYGYQTIDNSPLTGSNYPCKVTSDPATFYSQAGIDNTYAAGSVQTLSFKGSAVHGGGSCQLAITSDMQPSVDTDWRVILSIESGCPSTDGTSASTYNWTVPEDLAAGQYSFAWTWISKLAGQPEYYMNCAPITVTASSSSKRAAASEDYPELFVANLDSVNSCKTSPGTDVVYPDPGPNVEKLLKGATPSFASISQDGCVPKSQSQGASSLPTATAGGGSDTAGSSSASVATTAITSSSSSSSAAGGAAASGGVFFTTATTSKGASAATTSDMTTSTTAAATTGEASTTSSSTSTALSVYVSPIVQSSSSAQATTASSNSSSSASFATPSSAAATTTTGSTTSSSAATTTETTNTTAETTKTSATSSSSSSASATATGSASGSGSGSGSGGNSTSSAAPKSGTCADEGTFNCVGAQYQQCASGAWTEMRSLPSGTTCQQGTSSTLWARGAGGARSQTDVNLLRRARRGGVGVGGIVGGAA